MNSNEIGSQSLGKFHDEENNFTNTANLNNDRSSNPTTVCYSEKSKHVAETSYGYPIIMAEDDKVQQAEERNIILEYGASSQHILNSEKINNSGPVDIKKKKQALSLEKKFEIIMYKDTNPTVTWRQLGAKFGIPRSTVISFFGKRDRIIEAMKNPQLAKLQRLSKNVKWHKKQLKKNLPLPDSKLEQLKELEDKKKQKKLEELQDKPRTCIRIGRTRLTLLEKLQFIKRWEEEKAKNPKIAVLAVAKMLNLDGATLRSMILISDKIKRALLIPETADMISIPREKLLRKMFDDAGIDFPPLPEKEPEPEGPPDFWFTLSAGDISEVVETTLNHCQFDQVEHARFVMNLRELWWNQQVG
ncbi:unnamed protein product [Oikopleura dioica]|uniref:HTH psq-type domain-containing protein n=1 Tax=Oikopleura dioica TaxID=34765 RepID=E4X4Y9_OIKDI|nr:unnamed protein product [Oikopleura dioica]